LSAVLVAADSGGGGNGGSSFALLNAGGRCMDGRGWRMNLPKGCKYVTQAASISCIVHNAIFSNLSSGTPTASHQRTFLGCGEIRVL